jgi:hypothetical protein
MRVERRGVMAARRVRASLSHGSPVLAAVVSIWWRPSDENPWMANSAPARSRRCPSSSAASRLLRSIHPPSVSARRAAFTSK